MDRDDFSSRGREQGAGVTAGRPIGRIDDDAQPVETTAGQRAEHVLPVLRAVLDVDELRRIAHGCGQVANHALDALLDLVGELGPAPREQLDPVVPIRVVGRRDHRSERVATRRFVGDDRRRNHAEPVDDDPFSGQAGDERGFEHRRGQPGVATDHGLRSSEHTRCGAAEIQREGGSEVGVGDAANAVGAELHGPGRALTAW